MRQHVISYMLEYKYLWKHVFHGLIAWIAPCLRQHVLFWRGPQPSFLPHAVFWGPPVWLAGTRPIRPSKECAQWNLWTGLSVFVLVETVQRVWLWSWHIPRPKSKRQREREMYVNAQSLIIVYCTSCSQKWYWSFRNVCKTSFHRDLSIVMVVFL